MSTSESISDPLFWPLFLAAFVTVVVVLAFVWVVHRITTPRPEPPRDQRQRAGDGGVNHYDASSHSATTISVGEVNIGAPKMPGPSAP